MNWTNKCYSRLLIDNHITDHHANYMRAFDPQEYFRLVKLSGTEAAMVYACDHNGNCYYPTRVGHQHRNLDGRDIFGETAALLAAGGIVPIAYYTLIFHNDLWARHPEARTRDIKGIDHHGRYHYVCCNHPATAAFHQAQLAEILEHREIRGIFLDMTFWPMICCCDTCRKKFRRMYHLEIPETVNWQDPAWVKFQRFREKSMADFAREMTNFVKKLRPEITVAHQFSPVLHGWFLGQSAGIAEASDYASGDFYGGKMQQRFAVKAFDAFTTEKPYEFMTSRCVSLRDHTSAKPKTELLLHAWTTLANGGAYFFIDAINPDGTLEEKFYHTLRRINETLAPFREAVAKRRSALRAGVGVYFSMPSCVGSVSGTTLRELSDCDSNNMTIRRNEVMEETMGIVRILVENHIPCKLVTERCTDWSQFDAVIVGNAAYLSVAETAKMRAFVNGGGTLIATGKTSLYDEEGNGNGDFALADVFGVRFTGKCTGKASYLSAGGKRIFSDTVSPLVEATGNCRIRAVVNLPDFPADDPDHYASIHSNPPGLQDSSFAALTENGFGKGRAVYLYSDILTGKEFSHRDFGWELFAEYLPPPAVTAENLPVSAEITLLGSDRKFPDFVTVVNYQDDLPPIPLRDVVIALHAPHFAGKIRRVSDGEDIPFERNGDRISFTAKEICLAEFFELQP